MAALGAQTHVEEVRTEGKSFGPVTHNQAYAGGLVILIIFIAGLFGVAIPAEVASAASMFILLGIGYLVKGRKVVETTHVIEPAPQNEGDSIV